MGMSIAIAGCGIGGLAAASLLRRDGQQVTIFERFPEPAPVGSGLVIQPVGQSVLAEIGVLDEALAYGARIDRMVGHEARSNRIVLDAQYTQGGADSFGLAIHRASLFSVLLAAATKSGVDIETNAEVIEVSPAPQRRILLKDGRSFGPFDLIIDAAGASSPLRRDFGKPLSYGAIWGNVNWSDALPFNENELRQKYLGARNMLGILPIGTLPGSQTRQAAIFWSLPQETYAKWAKTPLDDWKQQAYALWPEFHHCLEQITDHDQMVMARYRHGTKQSPVAEELAHIGDAAHMASPQLGQGANMALLDAHALTLALAARQSSAEALALYAKARRWHVFIYQALSAIFTPMYQSDSRILPIIRDHMLMPVSRIPPVPRILRRIVCGDMAHPYAGLCAPRTKANSIRCETSAETN